MILKAEEYFPDLLTKEIKVDTIIKIIIVSFGWKKRKDNLLDGVDEMERTFTCVKSETKEENQVRGFCINFQNAN